MTIFDSEFSQETFLQYLRERTGMILFDSEFSGVVGEQFLYALLDNLSKQGLLQYTKTHMKAFRIDSVA
ncbi:hypothetical protein AT507_001887 [Escherichia coli]|uniref:hypothetical protein n=1 Tax=Escherichia coli TaxID=562 RepID=UPI0005CFC40F|nr:hypothetical protein [Escherichia coli]EEW1747651.1 hypothetical protein [Escherichia coli]EFD0463604.1 hypothetical protein [Escherichia coli]EFF0564767.1 hypothetical protein [Escherichia coli]EFO4428582.1 hypothetical protein [Escherichia coli]EKD3399994.1 hypothetical protein [Escherichia coli]